MFKVRGTALAGGNVLRATQPFKVEDKNHDITIATSISSCADTDWTGLGI